MRQRTREEWEALAWYCEARRNRLLARHAGTYLTHEVRRRADEWRYAAQRCGRYATITSEKEAT